MDENDSRLEKQEFDKVQMKDGKWFMRFDEKTIGAEISEDIARIIKLALWSEGRKQQSPNNRTRELHKNINCHRTAFAAVGLTNERHNIGSGHVLLPDRAFKRFSSPDKFSTHAQSVLGNQVGLVQIRPSIDSKWAIHSFIGAFDNRGRMVCFEKRGWRDPFRVTLVENIYNSYYRADLWAVGPIGEVKESDLAVKIPVKRANDLKSN